MKTLPRVITANTTRMNYVRFAKPLAGGSLMTRSKIIVVAALLVLATTPLLASADLTVAAGQPSNLTIRAGFPYGISFSVRNAGPDVATNVTASVTSTADFTCSPCTLVNIPAGQTRFVSMIVNAPATAGTITVNVTVSSGAADPNPSDNSASQTIIVSADPDLSLNLSAPAHLDLGLPFPFDIFLSNNSITNAHDVDVTVDFRTDVGIQSLPSRCSSPSAGRIVCHFDTLEPQSPQPAFRTTLVAPAAFGSGSIVFDAKATERENDFDPASNVRTITAALNDTVYVTTTADDGAGSLRQAILDANAHCSGAAFCVIAFRIAEPSATPWKTIRIATPLPRITAPVVHVDGSTQTAFFGNTNSDGPEVEISGGGTVNGDGLHVTDCSAEVAGLAINGFLGNGISVSAGVPNSPGCSRFSGSTLHDLFIGTDPTGSSARPNGRGIGISVPSGNGFSDTLGATSILHCVVSGNVHSGIFGLSGRLNVTGNRVGVKAHADEPLPNGASGIFVGAGCYGSDIGATGFIAGGGNPTADGNVIAFNGETGVAVASGVGDVAIRDNRIFGNALLGIDIGLNGPTPDGAVTPTPLLTLAHYDPVSGRTVIEGDLPRSVVGTFGPLIHFYASDAGDPSGYGEGQRALGSISVTQQQLHFSFSTPGNLTGQFISATTTRLNYVGFAKPEAIKSAGVTEGLLSQTSEFSRWIEVR